MSNSYNLKVMSDSYNLTIKKKIRKEINMAYGHRRAAASGAYVGAKAVTSSKEELVLMLFDGAVKFCNMARMALERNELDKVNTNISKVKDIILEFRNNLDFQYEVAKDFDKMYAYIYDTLTKANVKKDMELLKEALDRIKTMRETWIEVMEKNKEQGITLRL